jgi:hypothetical protein
VQSAECRVQSAEWREESESQSIVPPWTMSHDETSPHAHDQLYE